VLRIPADDLASVKDERRYHSHGENVSDTLDKRFDRAFSGRHM
jgi:hypothetical protein